MAGSGIEGDRGGEMPPGLVLGFEPFAGLRRNPACELAEAVDGTMVRGIPIVGRRLPVSLARVPDQVDRLIAAHAPAFVVALGLAAGATSVRVEALAVNSIHLSVPDNDGAQPRDGRAVDPDGPAARLARWDAPVLAAAIRASGVPARASFHAGTHLCNFTLYHLLGRLPPSVPCGFLHLPHASDAVAAMASDAAEMPSLSAGDLATALDVVLRALSADTAASRAGDRATSELTSEE